ncbi:putative tarF (CDP-glycerol glycerophosphotransferase family protein) [Desulforapulum autotrophicum HRM2]|uniref:TarF (CDP-glycerol glycerophosphotransferase family protein) n=1 Tax=Desulforapulum autotrophicum (strain ATCC 43914 / DSM 3382 / VKM B-1955 / HRM2) TaxID=177437 RepID=C0QBR0_DESAH|nr:putative tarF (CDP-glycerol glycerophosphotransferase family protein) [Desulforapulum autotrophicum]ACN14922.1 putative tarF (CDP-glycerol glycerophosphotransferase family protein) [Desulforapulum autotrophicum HRM2]
MKKKSVGFLFLGPISHIYHSISIAFHLSNYPDFDVTLFVSSELNLKLVNTISKSYKYHQCEIEYLYPSILHKALRLFKKRAHPRVRNVLQNNKNKLINFDALVLTDRHFINGGRKKPFYFLTGHGAGDRARGFTDTMKKFDFIFVSGKEKWQRMAKLNYISEERGCIIGYPKFEIVSLKKKNGTLFKNNNPIVLYNPHFNKNETSWYLWGEQILNFFLNNKNYNLIFAPHLILFSKETEPIDTKYYHSKNIHIDINSHALVDMTYTIAADIYLGDVSSQVYEFVGYKKRPCIFLNPHHAEWQDNSSFRMWKMGDVIDTMDNFEQALLKSETTHPLFYHIQKELIENTFSTTEQSAGKRGADAIVAFFEKNRTDCRSALCDNSLAR